MLLDKSQFFPGCRIRQAGLSFEAMFEEVPILIRNSHLVNTLLCEIEEETPSETKYNFLDLSTRYCACSSSNKHHLSNSDCLKEKIIRTVLCCIVYYTVFQKGCHLTPVGNFIKS